jgi:hypothetical protein
MLAYDPFAPEVLEDPYPTYRRLRDEAPAYHLAQYDCWALSRFEDIQAAAADHDAFSIARGSTSGHLLSKSMPTDGGVFMTMDPPGHTPWRALISPAFRPRAVAALEPAIRDIVATTLDPLLEAGALDAVRDVAQPVAARVACLMMGLPLEDGAPLREHVEAFQIFFHHRPSDDADLAVRDRAAGALLRSLMTRVRERREQSSDGDDLLGRLLRAEIDGRKLDDRQICSNLMTIFIGAVETVPKHFGSLVHLLHRHPEQRAKVTANPELLPRAVDEALRFDAPTHLLGRSVRHDVELHGETLRAGQGVLLLWASGNRDERVIERPDVFDVTRGPGAMLTFGSGTHLCLGMHVARLESRLMLERIASRMPDYTVDEARVVPCRLAGIRGFESVPIRASA